MTTRTVTPYRSPVTAGRESFWHLVHAEWTKFRTVRGWVIAMIVTIVAITAFAFLAGSVSGGCTVVSGASAAPARPPARYSRPGLAVSRSRTRSTSCTSR